LISKPPIVGFEILSGRLPRDGFGNLWIGDDPGGGEINFSGRPWLIPAARLASIKRVDSASISLP
jgi:hypothetical protein